jgi:hypothetical protein
MWLMPSLARRLAQPKLQLYRQAMPFVRPLKIAIPGINDKILSTLTKATISIFDPLCLSVVSFLISTFRIGS